MHLSNSSFLFLRCMIVPHTCIFHYDKQVLFQECIFYYIHRSYLNHSEYQHTCFHNRPFHLSREDCNWKLRRFLPDKLFQMNIYYRMSHSSYCLSKHRCTLNCNIAQESHTSRNNCKHKPLLCIYFQVENMPIHSHHN